MFDKKTYEEALAKENKKRKKCGLPPKDFKSLGIEWYDYTTGVHIDKMKENDNE